MLESEAKQKWCPFVRHHNGSDGVGVNRVNWDSSYSYANCIGSECMAWRKYTATNKNLTPGAGADYEAGYCGLAGAVS